MTKIHHRQGREFVYLLAGVVCAGALSMSSAKATLLLQFDGGGSSDNPVTNEIDAFTGMVGDGWTTSWALMEQIPDNTDTSAAVINTTPFSTGSGNYLSINYKNNTSTASRAGVVRRFSTDTGVGGVDITKKFFVNFELRIDDFGEQAMNTANDQFYFSLGPNSVSSFSTNSPVRIFFQGNQGWQINNGNTYGLIPGLSTGITAGLVYKFSIAIDPVSGTWDLTLTYNGQEYVVNDLALWPDAQLINATYLSWRGTRSENELEWSLDNVQVTAVPEPGAVTMLTIAGIAFMLHRFPRRR